MAVLQISDQDLTFYSSWASIISLFISIVSLWFVRSIRANIIKFRRKQRVSKIIQEINTIPDDAIPLSKASKRKLDSLKRNIPVSFLSRFTKRGQIAIAIHKHITEEDLSGLREAIHDWSSYSEEL